MANAEAGTPFCLVHGCPLEAEDSGGRQDWPTSLDPQPFSSPWTDSRTFLQLLAVTLF